MDALYNHIGVDYDNTRKADRWITNRLFHYLRIREGERYLDVACGTGNYTIALSSLGARITGFDASHVMLSAAQVKAPPSELLDWQRAAVETTPFATGMFAGAVCVLAIHHFNDLFRAFQEVSRVLDPAAGRFVIFTSTPEQMERYWLGHYFPSMMRQSAQQMPSFKCVTAALRSANLDVIRTEPYSVKPDLEDMFLYSGKHRPRLYLDPRLRAGISSFSSLTDAAETESGLLRLADDIESGAIGNIVGAANHDDGDYLLISAERPS